MFHFFGAHSERRKRYKNLYNSWERFVLQNPPDVPVMSEMAAQRLIVTFIPIAESYGIPCKHDPETLVTTISADHLFKMSESCLTMADHYKTEGSPRLYQGAILAGLYFGVGALVVLRERWISSLWQRVNRSVSLAVRLAARDAKEKIRQPESCQTEQQPLNSATSDALRRTSITEARFHELNRIREAELSNIDEQILKLFKEQQSLFSEVEKASEIVSPSEIYGAAMTIMNLFERVLARKGPPIGAPEPEVTAAGMSRFLDRLLNANEKQIVIVERLSDSLCAKQQDRTSLLGAKTTRVVVLGRFLNFKLEKLAPYCAHEAQWLSKTLLFDLETLSLNELQENRFDSPHTHAHPEPASDNGHSGSDKADLWNVSSLLQGQDQFADEIESLSESDRKAAYGALVSIVHQLTRMKLGLGTPVALDDIEVFVVSFENYIDGLKGLTSQNIQLDYATVRRGIVARDDFPQIQYGSQALLVIILGEMIRRQPTPDGVPDMSGLERARRMLDHLRGRGLGREA